MKTLRKICSAVVILALCLGMVSPAALAADSGFNWQIENSSGQVTSSGTSDPVSQSNLMTNTLVITGGTGSNISTTGIGGTLELRGGIINASGNISSAQYATITSGTIKVTGEITAVQTITISGGNITANSISIDTYGDSFTLALNITGGVVDVGSITIKNSGTSNANSTFTVNGNSAVVFADTVTVTAGGSSSKNYQNGVVFEGTNGTVYGEVTLPDGVTIPAGYTLTIPSGASLTVPTGTTLTNNGTITVEDGGTFTNSGTIEDYGKIEGNVTGTQPQTPAIVSVTVDPTTATYGSTVTLTATVKDSNDTAATDGTVTFYRGEASGTPLGSGSITSDSSGEASYQVSLNGTDWNPASSPYTIIAVYEPGTNSNLLSGSGQGSLTVSKASQATAPTAPTQSGTATADTITLTEQSGGQNGVEYACVQGSGTGITAPTDDDDWQTETAFNDLQAGTAYTFFARYAGNDFYEASGLSTGTTIYTAHATPTGNEGYTINYADETVTATDGYEVRLTDNDTWTSSTVLSITPGGTFQVRHAETSGGAPASAATTVNVTARPNAPDLEIDTEAEGVTLSNEYYYNTTSADYSAEGWAQGNGSLVPVDPQGTIYIYAAATGSAFKSAVQTLEAPARGSTLSVPGIDYEDEALSGTTTDMQYRVRENGEWKDCTANMSLTSFDWDGSEEVTVYFRTKATNDSYASDPTEALTIPARPAAPAAPEVSDKTDASITITATSGVQYRLGDNGQ